MSRPGKALNLWKKELGVIPDSVWEEADVETLILADNHLSHLRTNAGGGRFNLTQPA